MTRNAKKELREIFYDSLINDNNQWIKEMKSDCHGSWIEYKSPRYENLYFKYCKLNGLCYVYFSNIDKKYVFHPRLFNFRRHIKKIEDRSAFNLHDDLLREIDVYKWYKENN